MSRLRDEIIGILNDPGTMRRSTTRTADLILAAVGPSQTARSTVTIEQPRGIDQGVTRLAFRAFVAGLPDTAWNGTDEDGGSGQWVRYRGHVIDRESSDDGWVIGVTYTDHNGSTMYGRYPGGDGADTNTGIHVDQSWTSDTMREIDDLLDAVIAEHGVPGDEIPDAEIVENIDGATARRVLDAWGSWLFVEPVQTGGTSADLVAAFAAAIDRDEVQP